MTPLVFAILAAAVGLAVVAVGAALVAREGARRQRLELERRLRSQRLIMERVDWVAGLARARPQSGEMPAAQEPAAMFVAAPTRPVVASTDQAMPESGSTDLSPRRRLWRDASAVLFVGVLGALAFSLVGTPGGAPEGGVLAVTSAPVESPPAAASGLPSAAPEATSAPTHDASPSARPSPSATPTATPTPTPTLRPNPRPRRAPSRPRRRRRVPLRGRRCGRRRRRRRPRAPRPP